MVHLGVVQHGHKLFHECLASDLFVKGSVASVDQNVEQTEAEKDDAELLKAKSLKKLFANDLGTERKE